MIRSIRLGGAALLVAAVVSLPAVVHAQSPAPRAMGFDISSSNSLFSGFVTKGPDAGMHLEGLLSLTAGAGTLTLGNGTAAPASASGMTATATLPTGTIRGMGAAAGMSSFAGTFTGPRANDQGFWVASLAKTVLNYGVTGNVATGPHHGNSVLIGDLFGYVTGDGAMFGTYTDNSKVGPGIVPKVYPVHGTFTGSMLAASIVFNPMTSYALVGRVGKFYGLDRVAGALMGPTSHDQGTWAGLAQ